MLKRNKKIILSSAIFLASFSLTYAYTWNNDMQSLSNSIGFEKTIEKEGAEEIKNNLFWLKTQIDSLNAAGSASAINDLTDAKTNSNSVFLGLSSGINNDRDAYNTAVGYQSQYYNLWDIVATYLKNPKFGPATNWDGDQIWSENTNNGWYIRRIIYTTNTVEGFNRQIRKVTKSKGDLPTTTLFLNWSIWSIRIYQEMG